MFTFKQRVMIAYQVVRGLAHLHTNKIVHGMLVPRNITFSQVCCQGRGLVVVG